MLCPHGKNDLKNAGHFLMTYAKNEGQKFPQSAQKNEIRDTRQIKYESGNRRPYACATGSKLAANQSLGFVHRAKR
jgi:hypothetical protein